jgi:hypothetical protein
MPGGITLNCPFGDLPKAGFDGSPKFNVAKRFAIVGFFLSSNVIIK